MQNASLDFDPATFAPTFHLTVGIPGGSNALATAARLGLDAAIVENARSMLSQGAREVEALIASLNREHDTARALRESLENTRTETERLKKDLDKGLRDLRVRERTVIQETRDRVVQEASDLQRQIREAEVELRKQKSRDAVERTRRVLATVRDRLQSERFKPPPTPEEPAEDTGTIMVGDTVWLKDASVEAKVLAIDERNNEVEVQAGQTRIKLGLNAIERIVPGKGDAPRRYVPVIKPTPKQVPTELLLLGKRAEEVEELLNRYLDDATMAGLSQVRIVHGSGTGVLRQIVREMLPRHPLAKSFRPGERGEGGNGVTVVRL
jgi:DNA mismatch repair protein MutS2